MPLRAHPTAQDPPAQKSELLLNKWAYAHVESNYHPCGTCIMGIDDKVVTDGEGRVHGLNNLWVVDASIIPSIPTGNLNATTIMVAEKIADSILGLSPLEPEYPVTKRL